MQEAAGARAVAAQVGAVAGLRCGAVHRVSRTARHQAPRHQDGGVVALRDGRDRREGAGSWRRDRSSMTAPRFGFV